MLVVELCFYCVKADIPVLRVLPDDMLTLVQRVNGTLPRVASGGII